MKQNWEYKKLGEVGSVITGSTPPTKEEKNYESNDVCFIKPSDFLENGINYLSNSEYFISNFAYANSRQLPKGAVLTTCIGNIGKVAILEVDATCNQQINAIIPNVETNSKFLAYSIISQRFLLQSMANAPVVPLLNKTQFSNISIPVPPLSTQTAIVSELDALSAIIADHKSLLKKYDELEQSIFYHMFGDPVKNDKGWEVKKLGEVCTKIGSGATPKGGDSAYISEGVSLIRSLNVYNTGFRYKDLAHIDDAQASALDNVKIETNDVLLNITGASVARCCVVPNDILPARVNQHVSILRCINDILEPIFLNFQLISAEYQITLLMVSKSNGATREALTKAQLQNFQVIVPPLPLQQEFASKIEAIESMKADTKKSLAKSEELFNARMDYYFNA